MCILLFDGFITYSLVSSFDFSFGLLFLVALVNLIFLSVFYVFLTDLKRVYVEDSTLYVYDLYSRIPYILFLKDLKEVKKEMRAFNMILGVYKLSFAVEGSYYHFTFSFIKNKLIFDLRKYI